MSIFLSIIIPTRNRSTKLKKTLDSISNQQHLEDRYEVLVIDNGSTDNTRELCAEYFDRIRNFRYVFENEPGLHRGRNRGIVESRGEILAYLDDDVILFPNWLKTINNVFMDDSVIAACGSVVPYDFSIIPDDLWKYKKRMSGFEVLSPISCFWQRGITEETYTIRECPPELLYGANASYRKDFLIKCKGFHPDGMPSNMLKYRGDGETYITNQLKENEARVVYNSQMSVFHMIDAGRVGRKYISYMFFRNGISEMYTLLRNSENKPVKKGMNKVIDDLLYVRFNPYFVIGEMYLLYHYVFDHDVKAWINKENYM